MKFLVKKLDPKAKLPVYATSGSIGADVFTLNDVTVRAFESNIIGTGIAVCIPSGYYLRIAPKSGLSVKGIDVLAGVVDEDYRGEIKVILTSILGDVKFKAGEKIAQIILERADRGEIIEVDTLPECEAHNGFGSTGST